MAADVHRALQSATMVTFVLSVLSVTVTASAVLMLAFAALALVLLLLWSFSHLPAVIRLR